MKYLLLTVLAFSFTISTLAGPLVQTTFTNADAQFSTQASQWFNDGGNPPGGPIVTVNDNNRYQTMAGFGAALPESSAFLLKNLPSDIYQQTLNKIFNPDLGVGMNHIRLPISACDFSLSDWTYDDLPDGQTDPNLQHFSINHDVQNIIPVLKDIKKINPNLKIIATPWSPPAWMKNTHSLLGNVNGQDSHLLDEYKDTYAFYLANFIQAYEKQGLHIDLLTIQNEPLNGATGYPGLVMDEYAQSDFINNHLAKVFLARGISTKVLVYDHNWDREDYPAYVLQNLNSDAAQIVAGAAFHCYGGDVSAQTNLHNQFPDKHIYFTECSGGDWAPDFNNNLVWDMQNLLIGSANNWGEATLKWCLALDQNDGPQHGGCNNCRGLLKIHTDSHQVDYNSDFYSIAIFSKFVKAGAIRVDVSSNDGNFIAAGFINPDNSRVVIVTNTGGSDNQFSLSWDNKYIQSTVPGQTVASYTWNPSSYISI